MNGAELAHKNVSDHHLYQPSASLRYEHVREVVSI